MKILAMLVIGFSLLFGTVDINNADKTELMSLKGIGVKKAEAILAYRALHCFKSLEELTAVKGIGAKFIENNVKNITVGSCKK
ncbi:MAG TPA: helix-hairpin-helix domain-containing protein [Sulfurimonas autotrophica]|nr:helix-hairpin-helix domain-containing protein [Sulfurimonas autotrophica]